VTDQVTHTQTTGKIRLFYVLIPKILEQKRIHKNRCTTQRIGDSVIINILPLVL